MDWYHPDLGLVAASSPFTLGDVQYPADWLRLASSKERDHLGFIPTRWEDRPDEKLVFVADTYGSVEDGVYVVRWNFVPRDPADIAKAQAREDIARLEASITDRMWREDAVGSTAVMDFGQDDARTGKTATQYIAYVNDAIAVLRASL